MGAEKQYIELLSAHRTLIDENSAGQINAMRSTAVETLKQNGIPTGKHEDYGHIDMQSLYAPDYGLNLKRLGLRVSGEMYRCSVPGMKPLTAYVIGDVPSVHITENKSGAIITTIREACSAYPEIISKYYGRLSSKSADGTVALNTALAQDGLFIHIPDGVKMTMPLQIVNIMQSPEPLMTNRRLLIVAGRGAEGEILVCDHNFSVAGTLSTQVTEIYAEEGASLQYYEVEETTLKASRVASLFAEQQAMSRLLLDTITLHNGITRNNYDISLAGEGAEIELVGMGIADKTQKIDNYTRIRHIAPRCTSNELFKYILDEEATAIFKGSIIVENRADKSVARQTNKNISLSPSAHVYTEPQLEIYADDVKCGHGATVGQLDESALFYLRQRGIPEAEARMMLMLAFTGDIIEKVRLAPLKERLTYLIDNRLRGGIDRCEGCAMCK